MAATEQAFAAAPGYFAGARVVQSPFQFVADADTFLRVVSACSVTGVTLAVQGRRLDDHGQLQVLQETHAPNSDRSVKTQDYQLGPGAVLNVTVFASAGAPLVGQCYVMVQLLRNMGGTAIVLGTLLAGYVTAHQALGFPGSPLVSSTAGEPAIRDISGTVPAAGANLTETCPAGARWELVSILFTLTTNGTVGNRNLALEMFDPVGTINGIYEPGVNVPASTTQWFQYGVGLTVFGVVTPSNVEYVCLPQRFYLPAGARFTTTIAGLQSGDQLSNPRYQVREWLEVA